MQCFQLTSAAVRAYRDRSPLLVLTISLSDSSSPVHQHFQSTLTSMGIYKDRHRSPGLNWKPETERIEWHGYRPMILPLPGIFQPTPVTTSLPVRRGDEVQWSAMLKPYCALNISNSHELNIMTCTKPHIGGVVVVCITIPTPDPTPLDIFAQLDVSSVAVHPLYASWLVRRPCLQGQRTKDGGSTLRRSYNPFGSEIGSFHCLNRHTRPLWSLGTDSSPRLTLRRIESLAAEASCLPILVAKP